MYPPDRAVTAVDVYQLRGMEPGASVFDLALAIAEGRRGRVLSILARNLDAGKRRFGSWVRWRGTIAGSGKSKGVAGSREGVKGAAEELANGSVEGCGHF